MRIVVSGTHASGKSTLVADLAAALPGSTVLGDPYDLVDDDLDPASAASFLAQLEITAERLEELPPGASVVAERGPADLLAYLAALADLGRGGVDPSSWERLRERTARAMGHVDVWVVVPLDPHAPIHVPAEEDPALRSATDAALLDLVDDDGLVAGVGRVVEVAGPHERRLATVLAVLDELTGPR